MALSSKPVLRQTQSLTMTPQMQQSLKVLQMSRAELEDFVQSEIEANPLLQRAPSGALPPSGSSEYSVEDFGTVQHSLQDHVAEQINLSIRDKTERHIAEALAETLDESGYLHADLAQIAKHLNVTPEQVMRVLRQCQAFEPAGLFARNLAECLRLQLIADDRLTAEMAILLKHLDLVAKRDFTTLKKLCDADDEELAELLDELRGLNPKPGLIFDSTPALTIIPDLLVTKTPSGEWSITLNPQALPRVLMNENYSRKLSDNNLSKDERQFLRACKQKANWLTRILDQRAQTVLNVGEQIITHQQAFLESGAVALKPLTMQMVANAIEMHESTISRVANQKYMMTPQGLFEYRYFFNSAIRGKTGDDIASEAVRIKIRTLIAQENIDSVLSDEAIVQKLDAEGIVIARRTVAKYREEIGIPSSAKRRREMKLHAPKR
ncbi:RNA polymerase factor sigma-54 [Ochrobactrum sp. SFR4]|uniref:RNA polymerase factor sigma-54 n=1 Tax=Ochrobactrum sp. SFR4 TaxID=2717368 RepID=UPI001C8C1CDF|nr:RNA polymerase factor sigma-54 [Ochrobactrum sp. SFR4]MBX8824511.1 RNA polymerase factor sigma-54 [Ochrobactrum sp. SFR4]